MRLKTVHITSKNKNLENFSKKPKSKQLLPKRKTRPTWHIYAIECENKSVYIGQTRDLGNRWNLHIAGKGADWTKKHKPIRLFPIETVKTIKDALIKEREWKTSTGRKRIRKIISEFGKSSFMGNS